MEELGDGLSPGGGGEEGGATVDHPVGGHGGHGHHLRPVVESSRGGRLGGRELTPQEELHERHVKFHEKHRGHEEMHLQMFLILIISLLLAQIILVEWKKRHYRSVPSYYTYSYASKHSFFRVQTVGFFGYIGFSMLYN